MHSQILYKLVKANVSLNSNLFSNENHFYSFLDQVLHATFLLLYNFSLLSNNSAHVTYKCSSKLNLD